MIVQNVGHGGATDLSFTSRGSSSARRRRSLEADRPRPRRPRDHDRRIGGQGRASSGPASTTRPGYAARMFGTLADAGVNIEMISTSEVRITCIIAEDALETALRALHDGVRARAAGIGGRRGRGGARPRGAAAAGDGRRHGSVRRPRSRAVRPASARRTTSSATGSAAGDAGGLRRGRRRADRGPRPRRPDVDRAARRRAAPARSASARPGWRRIASGGSRRSSSLAMAEAAEEVAGLPDGDDPAEVAERPRDRARRRRGRRPEARRRARRDGRPRHGRPARRRRDRAERRTGRRRTSRPIWRTTMTSLRDAAGRDAPIDRTRCSTPSSRGSRRASTRFTAARFDAGLGGPPAHDRRRSSSSIAGRHDRASVRALGVDGATGALVVDDADGDRRALGRRRRDPRTSAWRRV